MMPYYLTAKFALVDEIAKDIIRVNELRSLLNNIWSETKISIENIHDDFTYYFDTAITGVCDPHLNNLISLKVCSDLLLNEFAFLNVIEPRNYLLDFPLIVDDFLLLLFKIAKKNALLRFYDSQILNYISL